MYQRKQDAWQAQDQAWRRRDAAREVLDRAYQAKQSAYENQQDAWDHLQRVRDRNGPRIEDLNRQQQAAFENMKTAYDRASDAHNARDGASARMYADEGRRHKEEAQQAVAERRRLVEEIREAKPRHEASRLAFQRAKTEFDRAKTEHDRARSDHERTQAAFKSAKAEFDRAKKAFQARLAVVRTQREQRKDDKRSLARQAGIPVQYWDDVYVSTEADGSVNLYFGGLGEPTGPGHGHYVVDRYGTVTYARDPADDHGAHNFANEEAYIQRQREQGHSGGFGHPIHGSIDGEPITAAFGWGTKEGQTLLADGHVNLATFKQHGNHNHYGAGRGPNDNVKERFRYTGPGS